MPHFLVLTLKVQARYDDEENKEEYCYRDEHSGEWNIFANGSQAVGGE